MPEKDCGPDAYFDPLDNSCVHCGVICGPGSISQDFCENNCPGNVFGIGSLILVSSPVFLNSAINEL